jgi:hypothetical protein
MALQNDGSSRPGVAFLDADLQRVISAWAVQPEAIKGAIMALVGIIEPPVSSKTEG